jgi:Hypervirulence associated proteins TUDOR domain
MNDDFKTSDKVEWKTPQGKTTGVVKKKLTSPVDIKGHHVAAEKNNPQYLVESEKSGKPAAHKPETLKKI